MAIVDGFAFEPMVGDADDPAPSTRAEAPAPPLTFDVRTGAVSADTDA
jgi:hypothetical protein